MRAVDAVRPAWVFLENSPRIRTKGRHVVVGDLVARGYSWRDGILGAADVGAPHKRDRWWCLAKRTDANGVRNYNRKGASQTSGDGLATWVAKWPTPVARDFKDSGMFAVHPEKWKLAHRVGGQLNPGWVEWLMGWPTGHTESEHSATARSRSVPPQPGDC